MIGIIGLGNIGQTLLNGLLVTNYPEEGFSIYDVNEDALDLYKEHDAVSIAKNNAEVLKNSDVIFLCVKPYHFEPLAKEIRSDLSENQIIVSLAPNFSISKLQEMYSHQKIIRMMPSTSMQVRRGVISVCEAEAIAEDEHVKFDLLMRDMGYLFWTPEAGINQSIGIAGSGISFTYQFIEAMGQGGILNGLDAKTSYRIAAETLIGAGEMLLKTNQHPATLRDQSCTPGGLTIKGLTKLEEHGFKRAVIEAVKATYEKEE